MRGQHWYLYLIMDTYSRKIVASEIRDAESGELGSHRTGIAQPWKTAERRVKYTGYLNAVI